MCKKELILCVDDEENQLAVRKLVLESEGYAVLTASFGSAGVGSPCSTSRLILSCRTI